MVATVMGTVVLTQVGKEEWSSVVAFPTWGKPEIEGKWRSARRVWAVGVARLSMLHDGSGDCDPPTRWAALPMQVNRNLLRSEVSCGLVSGKGKTNAGGARRGGEAGGESGVAARSYTDTERSLTHDALSRTRRALSLPRARSRLAEDAVA